MQFNIDFLLSKLEELKIVLKEESIDVFLIQETKLTMSDKLPAIPGYTVERGDRTQLVGNQKNRGGGLIVGIKKNTPFKRVNIEIRRDPDKCTEWMTIEIPMSQQKKLRLTNIYIPPENSKAVNEDHISPDEWPCKEYDMILGDVNAHSLLWDNNTKNGTSDRRAEKIENWLASTGMACINDGTPTHVHRSTGRESAPDTTFVHSSLLDKVSWRTTKKLGSDHLPIIITYEEEMMKVNDKPKFKWKLSDADWENFAVDVEKNLPKNPDKLDINRLEKKFRKSILKSAKKNIGRKKIDQKTKSWMTADIKEAIKARNELRKTVGQNRKEWIEACKSTAEMIVKRKRQVWKEYVEGITATTESTQVWKTIRGMDGRRPPDKNNEVLEVDGKTYVEDIDKAKEFAKTYKSFSKIPVKKEDRILRRAVRKRMKRKPQASQESEQNFTLEELERVIAEAKNNKAAGEDDVPYEFIKHLGPNAKQLLLQLYNRCWEGERLSSSHF